MRRTNSKNNSQRATQIRSSANLLQQGSFNQQRGRSRYKSSRKTQEVSTEENDGTKEIGQKTKSRTIKDDK